MTPKGPPNRRVRTHCPYCSLNCGLEVVVEDERAVDFAPWKDAPLSSGALCSKGETAIELVHHPDRLDTPLIRRDGELMPASWDEALDAAANGFAEIASAHGNAGNAVLAGSALTNEKIFLLNRFAQRALISPNIDFAGRFYMSAASTAHLSAFGADRMMTPLAELRRAEVVVIVGAHISATFPVALPTLLNHVRKRGGQVIVVDPRAGSFVHADDIHVSLEPGTDAVFFNGVLREIVRQGLVNREFVENRTVRFTDAVSSAMPYTSELVERVADVPTVLLERVASIIGSTESCMYLHGRGAEQQASGAQNIQSLINVGLACGHVGRPGAGINMLTGQRNAQGTRDWVTRAVDSEPPPLSYHEILQGCRSGEIRGLLTVGTNMALSAPDLTRVREALRTVEHHVVIDPFLSRTAKLADVVLPGSVFAEELGTVTTLEGRVVRIDQAVEPIAGLSDYDIITELAERLGNPDGFEFDSVEAIFAEMTSGSASTALDHSGMSYDRIRSEDGLFWPCPAPQHPGTAQLHQTRFGHSDGKARFIAVAADESPRETNPEFPLVLTTGRTLPHFSSANQTGRIESQRRLAANPYVEIHPDTARAYQISRRTVVRLTSPLGSVRVPWRPNSGLRYDTVFMAFHWPQCNQLVGSDVDEDSKVLALKHTPVRIAAELTPTEDSTETSSATAP